MKANRKSKRICSSGKIKTNKGSKNRRSNNAMSNKKTHFRFLEIEIKICKKSCAKKTIER
jgi:hypothetical protein